MNTRALGTSLSRCWREKVSTSSACRKLRSNSSDSFAAALMRIEAETMIVHVQTLAASNRIMTLFTTRSA